MNEALLWTIVIILVLVVLVLVVTLLVIAKKATYMSRKDKDFIIYVIDIYIDYADELNVTSLEEHEIIVKQLKRIKENKLNDG